MPGFVKPEQSSPDIAVYVFEGGDEGGGVSSQVHRKLIIGILSLCLHTMRQRGVAVVMSYLVQPEIITRHCSAVCMCVEGDYLFIQCHSVADRHIDFSCHTGQVTFKIYLPRLKSGCP